MATTKWIVTESESKELRFEPMSPDERVDADTWYAFYESEQEAAQALLSQLESEPEFWAKDYMLQEAKKAIGQ